MLQSLTGLLIIFANVSVNLGVDMATKPILVITSFLYSTVNLPRNFAPQLSNNDCANCKLNISIDVLIYHTITYCNS